MTDPQKITGYRKLGPFEIDLINRIKAQGKELEKLTIDLASIEDTDKRWLAMGTTELQKGIMFLVRSVAKPESF